LEIPNTLGEPQVLAGASGRMLAAGQHQEFVFNGFGPSLQQFTAARDQGLNYLALYVVGWVDYTDELGITRRSAFCRRYEGKSDRMILAPDQEHEYTD
jgi:hypothetical protein